MIAVENLSLHQGAFRLVGVSLRLETGRYGVLMGKTGSGKTTILEAICGLRPIEGGRVVLMNQDVSALKPAERGVGYVPQDRALFQNRTVRHNLSFALEIRSWPPDKIAQRVGELAELLGIGPLLNRWPHNLSGGEAQRVALGRALSYHPGILMLDEPLSALDDETRDEMCGLLRSVQQQTGVTTLHITHNRGEANALADRVFLLQEGRIVEEAVA